ncbi:MAG: NAD(P)/FAD-dependent oxidoreductase [Gammaproteobacteria bacterium]|nr:NAD(P)/FAD-dependent oxidoreductase [Gammaproteobacteria bacterium]MDH5303118.1 NAD(P)/FAD-dependent oxidoreductase [Gammaproteobacteria bacterium]MDH5322160.1 NAD(P)/FAD-dependent oxidoreductase [Gammaproteobacteria bacterium]
MQNADAIVVGGGPAGSTCAWKLRREGLDVLVLDRAQFPRHKLCAGWVTPESMANLELVEDDYPLSFMSFDKLHLHYKVLTARPATRQHSIRRFEFDDFLLRRSGATVIQHKVIDIRRAGSDFIIDNRYRCKYLVGAGGTACPVYRRLFEERNPRNHALQTATYEQEFAYQWDNGECHLWFFDDGLPGYAWYVPKANGYLNIGLGGMAEKLKRRGGRVQDYWRGFVSRLEHHGLLRVHDLHPTGYSYYLRGRSDLVADSNAFLVGDAAGLATHDLCEGIGPAVQSGLLAADAIVSGRDYSLSTVTKLSGNSIVSKILQRAFAGE